MQWLFRGLRADTITRHAVAWLLISVLGYLLIALLTWQGVFQRLEQQAVDLRFLLRGARTSATQPQIVLVTIDDPSLDRLEEPLIFWGPYFTQVVTRLRGIGVKAIGLDVLQTISLERWLPDNDRQLAAAFSGSPQLIMISMWKNRADGRRQLLQPTDQLRYALADPSRQIGFADLYADDDGCIRQQALCEATTDVPVWSFATLVAGRAGLRLDPHTLSRQMPINYVGPSQTFHEVSFYRLIDRYWSEDDTAKLSQALRGKIVLIGARYTGCQDYYSTPFSNQRLINRQSDMAGVEIHANTIATLLDHRPLIYIPSWQPAMALLLFCVLIGWCYFYLRPLVSLLATGVLLAVWLIGAVVLFHDDIVVPVITPIFSSIALYAISYTYRYLVEDRQRRFVHDILGKFISPSVANQLLAHGTLPDLGGERRTVSVLFTDIRGFTPFCEQADQHLAVQLLNEYFSVVVPLVFRHQGTVDKYIGDAVMAIFGAPQDLPDHPDYAVRCALEVQQAFAALARQWEARGIHGLDIGIAIHSGPAVVGQVGIAERMEYTVIGDTVNFAARLEGANKALGTRILISEATYRAVRAPMVVEGPYDVRVKDTPVRAYAVRAYGTSQPAPEVTPTERQIH